MSQAVKNVSNNTEISKTNKERQTARVPVDLLIRLAFLIKKTGTSQSDVGASSFNQPHNNWDVSILATMELLCFMKFQTFTNP